MKRKHAEENNSSDVSEVDVIAKKSLLESNEKPLLELGDKVSLLKQRLKEEENEQAALKEFAKEMQSENSKEFVEIYLKTSPECKEIFSLFDIDGRIPAEKALWTLLAGHIKLSPFSFRKLLEISIVGASGLTRLVRTMGVIANVCLIFIAENKRSYVTFSRKKGTSQDVDVKNQLTLIWGVLEGILTVLSQQDESSSFYSIGPFIANKIIQNHMKQIYTSLGANASNQLSKNALKCMAVMLAQGRQSVKDFISTFDFTLKGLKLIAKKRDRKQKPDTRTCFVRFCLAFFVFGDSAVSKKILEEKGLAALILNDIHLDPPEIIIVTLQTLLEQVVNNPNILKKTKLLFFNPNILLKLTILLKNNDTEIQQITSDVLTKLCTSTKHGICFVSTDQGDHDKLLNPVLLKFMVSLKQQVLQQEFLFELTVKTLRTCPDIIAPYLSGLSLQLEPRPSDVWYSSMEFITKLLQVVETHETTNIDLLLKLAVPPVMTRMQFLSGLKSKTKRVQLLTLKLLQAILKRCFKLKKACEKNTASISTKILHLLPDISAVIAVRQNVMMKEGKKETPEKNKSKDEEMEVEDTSSETPCNVQVSVNQLIKVLANCDVPQEKDVNEESCSEMKQDLLLTSVDCLLMFQQLFTGILTDSGFNICKLLMFNEDCTEEIILKSLEIMSLEKTGIRGWIEKKISGSENVIHLLLYMISKKKNQSEVLKKLEKLFIKSMWCFTGKMVLSKDIDFRIQIMCLSDHCEEFQGEIYEWLGAFIDCVDSVESSQMICKKFSECCLKLLNEPFLYIQDILVENDVVDSSRQNDRLPFSPLTAIMVSSVMHEDFAPVFLFPVLKKIVMNQVQPKMLCDVVKKHAVGSSRCDEMLMFMQKWNFVMTGEDVKTKEMDTVSEDSGIDGIVSCLYQATVLKKNNRKKKNKYIDQAKELVSTLSKILSSEVITKQRNSSGTLYFYSNLLYIMHKLDYHIDFPKQCSKISHTILNALATNFAVQSDRTKKCIVDRFVKQSWFSVEDEFSLDCSLVFLKEFPDFQQSDEFDNLFENCIQSLCSGANTKDSEKAIKFIEFLLLHSSNEGLSVYATKLITHCFNKLGADTQENSDILDKISTVLNKCFLLERECTIDLENLKDVIQSFLVQSIKTKHFSAMNFFLIVLSFARKPLDFNVKKKELLCLLEPSNDDVCIRLFCFLCQHNTPYLDVFIEWFMNSSVVTKDGLKKYIILIELILKYIDCEKIKNESFGSYIVENHWSDLLHIAEQDDMLHAKSTLNLILPLASDDQKIDAIRQHSSSNTMYKVIENILVSLTDEKHRIRLTVVTFTNQLSSLASSKKFPKQTLEAVQKTINFLKNTDISLKLKYFEGLPEKWNSIMKHLLKYGITDEKALDVLCSCVGLLYSLKKFKKCDNVFSLNEIFQMVLSHSKFTEVLMVEKDNLSQKTNLIKLLATLLKLEPSIQMKNMLPLLLSSYRATQTESDHFILCILQHLEQNNAGLMLEYHPLVWGEGAYEIYKQRVQKQANLLNEQTSSEILANIDSKLMTKSAIDFPMNRPLMATIDDNVLPTDCYDPSFLLPIFSSILQPDIQFDCLHFIESGCLSFLLAALTSYDENMRKLAYYSLALYTDHLDSAKFKEKSQYLFPRERHIYAVKPLTGFNVGEICDCPQDKGTFQDIDIKVQVVYFFMLLKHSTTEDFMRLPTIWSTFFTRYFQSLLHPDQHIYPIMNNIVLQKPTINPRELPVFLTLLNSSSLEHSKEQRWLLKLLVDGFKDQKDYYLYKKYHVFEMLIALYDSNMIEKASKHFILSILIKASSIKTAAYDLIKTYALLSWVHACINRTKEVSSFIDILYTLSNTFKTCEESTAAPKLFSNEVIMACQQLNIKLLTPDNQLKICSIMTNAMSLQSNFGDLSTWIREGFSRDLLQLSCNLFLEEGNSNSLEEDAADAFVNLVKMVGQDVRDGVLKPTHLKKIMRKAKEMKNEKITSVLNDLDYSIY